VEAVQSGIMLLLMFAESCYFTH